MFWETDMTQVIIESLDHLKELEGQLICLELDLDYLRENSPESFKRVSGCNRFLWKVGKIENAFESVRDRYVVCWHANDPDVGICIRDSNIIPNNHNPHKAFVYDQELHGKIPLVTGSYEKVGVHMHIERREFNILRNLLGGEEDA